MKNKYETKAVSLMLLILCGIYGNDGYYLSLDDDMVSLLACDAELCDDDVENIIALGVKLGFFDKDMFLDHNILTSKEIQRQYLNAIHTRKAIYIEEDFYLLNNDPDVAQHIIEKIVFTRNGEIIQDNKLQINSDKLQINPDKLQISTQSKVKESKVNKSIVNQSTVKETKVEQSKVQESRVNESIEKESKQEESTVNNSIVEEKKVEESKEVSVPSFTSSLINSYTNNSTLSSLLTSYMEYRVKNNLDMSEKYINNLIHLLDKLADNDEQKIIIVDTALKKNWKSFFPIDFERIEKTTPPPNRDYIRGNENFDDEYLFGV